MKNNLTIKNRASEEMTPEFKEMVEEAEAELRVGKVSRKFTSVDKFIADLEK